MLKDIYFFGISIINLMNMRHSSPIDSKFDDYDASIHSGIP
jgi:hypothetical protein